MSESGIDSSLAIAALEEFVVDNDDLLELEEHTGRFNIFDALRIERVEIRHSNFFAWLLDPSSTHGQGPLFLRAILMDLLKTVRENGYDFPVSPIDLDGAELRGVTIRREWKHIDILITCEEPRFVVAIENKVDSGPSNPFQRYESVVQSAFESSPQLFVYLTPEGDELEEDNWTHYSYENIYAVLSRVRRTNEASIGDDVLVFLDHYLRLIGSRFMDDPKIDELCQRIYNNHRQAIDLIIERMGGPGKEIAALLEDLIKDDPRWIFISRSRHNNNVHFAHAQLVGSLPPIHKTGRKFNKIHNGDRCWIVHCLKPKETVVEYVTRVRPTTNDELKAEIIGRLTRDPDEFGLRKKSARLKANWSTIARKPWVKLPSDDDIDLESMRSIIQKRLDELDQNMMAASSHL